MILWVQTRLTQKTKRLRIIMKTEKSRFSFIIFRCLLKCDLVFSSCKMSIMLCFFLEVSIHRKLLPTLWVAFSIYFHYRMDAQLDLITRFDSIYRSIRDRFNLRGFKNNFNFFIVLIQFYSCYSDIFYYAFFDFN